MRRWSGLPGVRIGVIAVLTLSSLWSMFPESANAAGNELKRTIVRIDEMNTSATTKGSVCFQPQNTANIADFDVTFPTGFTVSTTNTDWTTSITEPAGADNVTHPGQNYWPAGYTALGVAPTWVSTTGQTVRFSLSGAPSLAPTNTYCFRWTTAAALTNPATPGVDLTGSVTTFTAGPTLQDKGNYALTVLDATGGGDHVTINATVPPTFEFALSSNTISFAGNLAYATVNASEANGAAGRVDATITTNAKGGWIMWAEESPSDPAIGLHSADATHTIPSVGWNSDAVSTLAPGTVEGDALDVTALPAATTYCSTSNLAVDPEYDTAGTPGSDGGAFEAEFAEIGTCTGNVSDGDGLRLSNHVAITPVTPSATDYTQTIIVVGAGNF